MHPGNTGRYFDRIGSATGDLWPYCGGYGDPYAIGGPYEAFCGYWTWETTGTVARGYDFDIAGSYRALA